MIGDEPKPQRRRWGLLPLTALFFAPLLIPAGRYWRLTRPVFHKDIINKYAGVYKIDPLFVMALVRVESSFQKSARSAKGAVGLMQLMPDTAKEMAKKVGRTADKGNWEDPDLNIHLGIEYLSQLKGEFPDDVAVLAAYNAGPANVRAWLKNGRLTAEGIPFPETRSFVGRVQSTQRWLKLFQRAKHFFHV